MIVVFPDAVAALLEVLADSLYIETGTRVPNPRPDQFILARRTGGNRFNPVQETVQIAFQCWAQTPADADDLAANARAILFKIAQPGSWSGSDLTNISIQRLDDVAGPADEPDALSDQPVATFSLQLVGRGIIMEESV